MLLRPLLVSLVKSSSRRGRFGVGRGDHGLSKWSLKFEFARHCVIPACLKRAAMYAISRIAKLIFAAECERASC